MLTNSTRFSSWSIFLGVLLVLTGLASITLPFFAGIAASVFFGWPLMVGGIAHLVYAWSERRAGAVLWQILIGIAYLVTSIYMLVLPVAGVVTLTLVLSFYILLEGIFELVVYVHLRSLHGAVWFFCRWFCFVAPCRPHFFPVAVEFPVGHRHIGGNQPSAERHRKSYVASICSGGIRRDRSGGRSHMRTMRPHRRPRLSVILIALLSLQLPLSAALIKNDNPQLTQLLADANEEAFELASDADDMQVSILSDGNWINHALMLARVKGHVDNLALIIDKFNKTHTSGSDLQQEAIDQILPMVKDLSANTTAAINYLNQNRASPISDTYTLYLKKNGETAHQLSSIISSLVDYEKSMAEIEELRSKLVAKGN